ncbi:hypothetical protein AAG747_11670 [Rapidithrix thailandica]|uniref:Uncharacterized protein n=1 Tax=Rapidithrix thailandica TaxID=413964 RepID=A0AAW9S3W6_9BACT
MTITDIRAALASEELQEAKYLKVEDSKCSLEELNDFLAKCNPEVWLLSLQCEQLEKIPENVRIFPELRELELYLPRLNEFPAFLEGSPLSHLILECTKLPEAPEAWKQKEASEIFPSLTYLTLKVEETEVFPAYFCLPGLKTLSLTGPIENVSEDIGTLPELEYVKLNLPRLNEFPAFLEGNPLSHLTLECTKLPEAPEAWKEKEASKLFPHLTHLELKVEKTEVFPACFCVPSLRHLELTGAKWRQFPREVSRLSNVEVFILVAPGFDMREFKKLPNLYRLCLQGISTFPQELEECHSLRILYITDAEIQELPPYVMELKHLDSLLIENSKLSKVPEDWSTMQSLVDLMLRNTQIEEFGFLFTIPKLERLLISGNPFPDPLFLMEGKKMLPIEDGLPFEFPSLSQKDAFRLMAALGKSGLSRSDKEWFFYQLQPLKKFAISEEWPLYRLLQALNIPFKPIQDHVVQRILSLAQQQESVTKLCAGSKVFMSGKFQQSKKEIKENMEALHLTLCNQWEEGISHLVIGKKPPVILPEETYAKVNVLLENQLYQVFEEADPKFLVQEARQGEQQMGEGVVQMLQSNDPATQQVALEMLKSGGIPETVFVELLLVQKCSEDADIRKEAKKLLEAYGPGEWLGIVRDRQLFTTMESSKEREISKKLEKLEKISGQELAAMLSLALYQRYGKGLNYTLANLPQKSEWHIKALEVLTSGDFLNFHKGVGYFDWRKTDPEEVMLSYVKTKIKFPSEHPQKERISKMDLHNCKLERLSKDVAKFDNLKELDASANYFKSLPKAIEKLQNLERLDLSFNRFPEFPMEVMSLKNLKFLNLRYNGKNQNLPPLQIPEEVQQALPECEILV